MPTPSFLIKRLVNRALGLANLKLVAARPATQPTSDVVDDYGSEFRAFYEQCKPYTMTGIERMFAAYQAANYVSERNIPGALVECGVWRGGSMMMMMMALLARGAQHREVYMYDTFEGMAEPGEKDVDFRGESARAAWETQKNGERNDWCYSSLDEVRENVRRLGYPLERVHFVKGKVEQTIPENAPQSVALLRLDTDWFESTYHELKHLYPRLTPGGVLIIDDYGFWRGAREATDQYFREEKMPVLLSRIDHCGRLVLKV